MSTSPNKRVLLRSTNRDEGQVILLFNGFQKKSQKTPTGEIGRGLKIRTAYISVLILVKETQLIMILFFEIL